jgi:hypothetical protein
MELTQAYLKTILHYDPLTGVFTNNIGKEPGYFKKDIGYRFIRVNKKYHPAHRLAFLYMLGEMPPEIDHLSGERADNRWCNLRSVTRLENTRNKRLYKNSKSGIAGVSWAKNAGKWLASIKVDGSSVHIGLYDSKFEAACARISRQNSLGFSERHGR